MGTVTDAVSQDYPTLRQSAACALRDASDRFARWVELVRDPDMPWAFRWSVDATRPANVAATHYVLLTARACGVLERVLTDEQRVQGIRWVQSLEERPGQFADPALFGRKPRNWDHDREGWPPDGANRETVNQYARGCLLLYRGERLDSMAGPPPSTWPQESDPNVLDWIKSVEPNWSWIGRMLHRLILWHHEGKTGDELLCQCIDYARSRQNTATGFWGGGIQTTFKLLITVYDPAELPVPRASQIIDSVLAVMDAPGYDDDLYPCEEFDAFYDLALAWTSAPGYRKEVIQSLAAHRVCHILETHTQADGGLSGFVDRCMTTWLDWDMAPEAAQGDAFAWAIYGAGMNICVDILDIADQVPWTGRWRQRDQYDTTPFVAAGRWLAKRTA